MSVNDDSVPSILFPFGLIEKTCNFYLNIREPTIYIFK